MEKNRDLIIYVGNFNYPNESASGKRVFYNGKALNSVGYEVVFIGVSKDFSFNSKLIETKKTFDGFDFYSLPYPAYLQWIRYKKQFKSVIELLKDFKKKPRYIINYGSPAISLFLAKLVNYARKENIFVIADCVEWFHFRTYNLLFDAVKNIDNYFQKVIINKRNDGIIVVSELLDRYYSNKGIKTLLLPPLNETYENKFIIQNSPTNFVYAGVPFKQGKRNLKKASMKDRLDKIIEIFDKMYDSEIPFKFEIIGVNKSDYLLSIPHQLALLDKLNMNVIFHGYKQSKYIYKKIQKADFTILMRDNNYKTNSGFSTKISESIGLGTPVITTKTSDITNYIFEAKNGYFIDANDLQSNLKKMGDIVQIGSSCLKKNLRKNNPFDYVNYRSKIRGFLAEIKLKEK